MKKIMTLFLVLFAAFTLIMVGCGGGDDGPIPGPAKYTVKFESNGGTAVDEIPDLASGSTISKPEDPSKAKFSFNGWYKEKDLTTPWNFESDTVSGNIADITLYAKWTKAEEDNDPDHRVYFTVTLMDDETTINSFEVAYGEKMATPVAPAKAGYNFVGWYTKKDTGGELVDENLTKWIFASKLVTTDTTLYAKYTEAKDPGPGPFTVRFVSEGKLLTYMTIKNVEKGSKISRPTQSPEKEDYDFDAWCKDEELTEAWNFGRDTVTSNINLYARFTPVIDDPPEDLERAEKVTLGNAWYVVYYFELPAGKTTADYTGLKASYTLTKTALKNGVARGARLMGPYPKEFFTYCMGAATGSAPGKGVAVASYNTANAPYILDNSRGADPWAKEAPDGVGTLITALEANIGYKPDPCEWFELTYSIDGSAAHADYGKGTPPPTMGDPAGPLFYGLGLPGQGPSSDQGAYANTFYIRDVTLMGKAGTTDVVGKPVYFKTKDGNVWPAYCGYFNTNGSAGHKEASREMCDDSVEPAVITVDWTTNLD